MKIAAIYVVVRKFLEFRSKKTLSFKEDMVRFRKMQTLY